MLMRARVWLAVKLLGGYEPVDSADLDAGGRLVLEPGETTVLRNLGAEPVALTAEFVADTAAVVA